MLKFSVQLGADSGCWPWFRLVNGKEADGTHTVGFTIRHLHVRLAWRRP